MTAPPGPGEDTVDGLVGDRPDERERQPSAATAPAAAPVWIVHAIAWVGLAATLGPGLLAATTASARDGLFGTGRPFGLSLVVAAWAALVWIPGVVALVTPRPWGLVVWRLGGLLVLVAGVGVALTPGVDAIWRALAVASGTYTAVLALHPSLGDRAVDGASYPGERRFAFRSPREAVGGIVVACVVPTIAMLASVAACVLSGAGRYVVGFVAGACVALSLVVVRQLWMLARRAMVFAPRAVALVDPYTLADSISIPLARILDMAVAPADVDADRLLDLRGGAGGDWVQMVFDSTMPVPDARPLPARVAAAWAPLPESVIGIAWPITRAEAAVAYAASVGLPVETGGASPLPRRAKGATGGSRTPLTRPVRRARRESSADDAAGMSGDDAPTGTDASASDTPT